MFFIFIFNLGWMIGEFLELILIYFYSSFWVVERFKNCVCVLMCFVMFDGTEMVLERMLEVKSSWIWNYNLKFQITIYIFNCISKPCSEHILAIRDQVMNIE